jgi:hypothetical protein
MDTMDAMERQQVGAAAAPARECGTCRFWQACPPELLIGECRLDGASYLEASGQPCPWHLTTCNDWCSEWHMVRLVRPGAASS